MHEGIELCSRMLINWFAREAKNQPIQYNDEIKNNLFIQKILMKKFEVFNIDIKIPQELFIILSICTNDNPGQTQILLKDLLKDIASKKPKKKIPKGYIITSQDFSFWSRTRFPILSEYPDLNKKYQKLWDGQKKEKKGTFDTDNLCDTPEWWLEVMED